MCITLNNGHLRVALNAYGAELCSVRCAESGFEYMWQADPEHWGRHAPILFPFIGETAGRRVLYDSHEADMQRHGFARTSMFTVDDRTAATCHFVLTDNIQSRAIYPFCFRFEVRYRLEGRTVYQTFRITNMGTVPMGFQVGGHPAFALPLGEGQSFIAFNHDFQLNRHLLNKEGLFSSQTRAVVTEGGKLMLVPGMFDEDAIVLKGTGISEATLGTTDGSRAVRVRFTGFPMLGVWSVQAMPFVCIEPWLGCADSDGATGRLWDKEGLITLSAHKTFEASFSIEFLR